MDEPLSNLDAKLRVSMRAELAKLHERLGVTTVYVTHDQVEAMTLGQRVAVLRDGTAPAGRHAAQPLPPAREPLRRGVHRLAVDEPRRRRRSTAARLSLRRLSASTLPAASPVAGLERPRDARDPPDRLRARRDAPMPSCRASRVTRRRGRGSRLREPRDLHDRRAARDAPRRCARRPSSPTATRGSCSPTTARSSPRVVDARRDRRRRHGRRARDRPHAPALLRSGHRSRARVGSARGRCRLGGLERLDVGDERLDVAGRDDPAPVRHAHDRRLAEHAAACGSRR